MYDKIKGTINTQKNSKLEIEEGYKLTSDNILYNIVERIISSDQNSILIDNDGNTVMVEMFQYQLEKDLFSSIGKIKIIDSKKNKYFFQQLHVDTQKKEMVGSDVSVVLDPENFGVKKENEPRFVANDIFMSKNKSNLP